MTAKTKEERSIESHIRVLKAAVIAKQLPTLTLIILKSAFEEELINRNKIKTTYKI